MMIITKMALSRRTVLRGLGATLALPMLDAMTPALLAKPATKAAPRVGFVYVPHGMNLDAWRPVGNANEIRTLSPILRPLAPFQDVLTVFSGLDHHEAEAFIDGGNGEHVRASAVWLAGVRPKRTEGADVQLGTTVDQRIAAAIGGDTMLPSLELGLEPNYMVGNCDNGYSCMYMNALAWRTPTTPLPLETNPRLVFERLFGIGGPLPERLTEFRRSRSILDAVTEDIARIRTKLGSRDRVAVGEYLDAVRQVEQRVQRAEKEGAEFEIPLMGRPVGIPDSFEEHARIMYELQALAFQADITRVVTFQVGREFSQRTYPDLGITTGHHTLSHHSNSAEKLADLAKLNTYHMSLFAAFLERLRATSDGDGTLLDHSMILYGSGLSDGDLHSHFDLPTIVVGGGACNLKGNRYIQHPDGVPMSNLLLGMMHKVGVESDAFGDSTGRIEI